MPHSTWPLGWTGSGGRTGAGDTTTADRGAFIDVAHPASDTHPVIASMAPRPLNRVTCPPLRSARVRHPYRQREGTTSAPRLADQRDHLLLTATRYGRTRPRPPTGGFHVPFHASGRPRA